MKQITAFAITKLHGSIDVEVPISDGKVILVGVNGLGKTTIVSMLYLVLTRQWQKLLEYDFEVIVLTLDGERIVVDRSVLELPDFAWQASIFDSIPVSILERLRNSKDFLSLLHGASNARVNRDEVLKVARKLDMPPSYVERLLYSTSAARTTSKKHRRTSKALQEIESRLEALAPQVLYLPTYRRIEQDLKSLFPEFEGDFRKVVRSRVMRDGRSGFVELVEFGMEDVEARVNSKVAALKESSRVELNNLAGSYLRDVIRGEAREWSADKINQLPDHEVRLILARVEEKQLDERDKGKVFEVINRIRNQQELDSDQDLLAHFFSKLVAIHETQQKAEVPLQQFIKVCNRYLQAKKFEFDDVGYGLSLILDRGGSVEMRGLSSGEKQIVSLFAQIYLGDAPSYSLIIDEPELSLSVEWQKTLLPDIINSERCNFLVAVTHSPFIYDNELFSYAKDLAEFQRVVG